jgi:hypothetical protein
VNIPILSGHCEVAQRIAERIGLPDEIRETLGQLYERWEEEGFKSFVADPSVPPILHEAGREGKPGAAKLVGRYGS